MHPYVKIVETEFHKHHNLEQSVPMAKYMKNRFEYLGIKNPERKEIQKRVIAEHGIPSIEEVETVIRELWDLPFREFHYFAMDLMDKYKNKVPKTTIELYHYMIVNQTWWDSVDAIASKHVGTLVMRFPELIDSHIEDWSKDKNMWLQRTAILYQLKYKEDVNTELLTRYIERAMGTKEFFLNKAIGWALRQYSKFNPQWVIDFVENHPALSNLSKKEALRVILK